MGCRDLLRAFVAAVFVLAAASELTPVRVSFLTDCKMYSDWQSVAMVYSWKMSGQPGSLTRVMCCEEKDVANYSKDLLEEVETHIAPSMAYHPILKDRYAAYNKPEAVIDWLDKVTPEEEFVLVLDSDMILRRPFLVEEMTPSLGLAVGARYTYMIGVNNELAMRHVPEVVPRNDTLAGPVGRRGDQVGGFFFIHRDDLKRMSHGWLKYTEDVRMDDMAWKYSGDSYATSAGSKPWISEMYGYSFGASKAGAWHKWDTTSMIYPGYEPRAMPRLMHYGLLFEVNGYKFDKHYHYDFDITKCPPWDFSSESHRNAGLFGHPPRISTLNNKDKILEYYRDVVAIETIATINAGFCDYHVRHCPPSRQLVDECKTAHLIYFEAAAEARRLEALITCMDMEPRCGDWAKSGECTKNVVYMTDTCKKSCDMCPHEADAKKYDKWLAPASRELAQALDALEQRLDAGEGVGKVASGDGVVPSEGAGGVGADPDAASAVPTGGSAVTVVVLKAAAAEASAAKAAAKATETAAAKTVSSASLPLESPLPPVIIPQDGGGSTGGGGGGAATTTAATGTGKTKAPPVIIPQNDGGGTGGGGGAATGTTTGTGKAKAPPVIIPQNGGGSTGGSGGSATTKTTTSMGKAKAPPVIIPQNDRGGTGGGGAATTTTTTGTGKAKAPPVIVPQNDGGSGSGSGVAAKATTGADAGAAATPDAGRVSTPSHAERVVEAGADGPPVDGARVKELVVRCYKMLELDVDEIKACVAGAKRGVAWSPTKLRRSALLDTTPHGVVDPEDLGLGGRGPPSPPALTPAERLKLRARNAAVSARGAPTWQLLLGGAAALALLWWLFGRRRGARRSKPGKRTE
ncbi:hypothetical protein FOA52_002558 [Chlamydomonas sp. UWO 241]|nr:hypothetical protein FOA52_002558 [Chlamydomonas sp. UWO 241]